MHEVVEWLMFACALENGMLRCFVVAQLDVWMGQDWLE